MEPGLKGKRLGADGWTARGIYSDGPRRLTGRPEPSEVEIFPRDLYVELRSRFCLAEHDYISDLQYKDTISIPD